MTPTPAINHPPPRPVYLTPSAVPGGEAGGAAPLPAAGDEVRRGAGAPRALVVDDAPDVAEMLGIMMRCAGYEVETALSATDALGLARSGRFDVVISDIGMPVMNGYEFAQRLRSTPGYERVPLIAVTGFTLYDDRARALDSGFDEFLTKPINTNDLIGAVTRRRG